MVPLNGSMAMSPSIQIQLASGMMCMWDPDHMCVRPQEVASTCKVRAMPTYQIFQQGQQVEQIVGADAKGLEALCIKYNAASSPFSGQGRKLGSASLTSKSAYLPNPCSSL